MYRRGGTTRAQHLLGYWICPRRDIRRYRKFAITVYGNGSTVDRQGAHNPLNKELAQTECNAGGEPPFAACK